MKKMERYMPKYMIVRIVNIIAEFKDGDGMLTEPCWVIMEKDLTIEKAFKTKDKFRYPENYIILSYYE